MGMSPEYAPVPKTELKQLIENPPIKPCGDFVLIRCEDIAETYGESKIVKPGQYNDREQKGVGIGYIVAVGPYAWHEDEAWAEVGDRVVYQRYEGVVPPVEGMDDGKFRCVNDNKIIGVVPWK